MASGKTWSTPLHEPFDFTLFGKLIEGFTVAQTALAPGVRDWVKKPTLAYIFGYATQGVLQRLPRPAIFVVDGDGEDPPKRYGKTFPEDEFRMWKAHPTDEFDTLRRPDRIAE